jgi:hypothetical protein
VPFGDQPAIEVGREDRSRRTFGVTDCVAVAPVVVAAAQPARPVPGRQGDRVVEEEEGRPPPGLVERVAPPAERRQADDPERAPVVAHDLAPIVDEAAPVAGEQPAAGRRVEITPRIDAVATSQVSRSRRRWPRR